MTNYPNLVAVRRTRLLGWLLAFLGWAAIVVSFPVDGLAGVFLAVFGVADLWCGWYLVLKAGKAGGNQ